MKQRRAMNNGMLMNIDSLEVLAFESYIFGAVVVVVLQLASFI